MAEYDKKKDSEESLLTAPAAPGEEFGTENAPVAVAKSKPTTSKPKKARKPRDGLCVMCKTYLFDETLGDRFCCGDACAEEYEEKQKTGASAPGPEGSDTPGGVKRKRDEANEVEPEGEAVA